MKALKLVPTSVLLAAIATSNLLIAQEKLTAGPSIAEKLEKIDEKAKLNIQDKVASSSAAIQDSLSPKFPYEGFLVGAGLGWHYIYKQDLGFNIEGEIEVGYQWKVLNNVSVGAVIKPMVAFHNYGVRGATIGIHGLWSDCRNIAVSGALSGGWNFSGKSGFFIDGVVKIQAALLKTKKLLLGIGIGFTSGTFGEDKTAQAAAPAAQAAAPAAQAAQAAAPAAQAAAPAAQAAQAAAPAANAAQGAQPQPAQPSEAGKQFCVRLQVALNYYI